MSDTDPVQFTVPDTDGFYVTVAEDVTVYETYADAVADIQQQLQTDADGFLAEVAIDGDGDTDDVAVTLEQVSWQQIIRDLPSSGEAEPGSETTAARGDATTARDTTADAETVVDGTSDGDD
jgi:hypothetical protein